MVASSIKKSKPSQQNAIQQHTLTESNMTSEMFFPPLMTGAKIFIYDPSSVFLTTHFNKRQASFQANSFGFSFFISKRKASRQL